MCVCNIFFFKNGNHQKNAQSNKKWPIIMHHEMHKKLMNNLFPIFDYTFVIENPSDYSILDVWNWLFSKRDSYEYITVCLYLFQSLSEFASQFSYFTNFFKTFIAYVLYRKL